jgi:indolepyruvate ferredoxin oxidoreductase
MIRDVRFSPSVERFEEAIARFTDRSRNVEVEARRLAEALFGDYLAANLLALGVAYQSGLLPLSATSIERAIELNGVQVEQSLQAFRYGRLQVLDPARLRALVEPPRPDAQAEREAALARLSGSNRRAYQALLERCGDLDAEARRMLAIRLAELVDYQNAAYAEQYLSFVLQVAAREQDATPGHAELTHAVIRSLYKLMAYKDEYEVARLHLKPDFQRATRDLFTAPRQVAYHLHPPLLRAFGLRRKLKLGPWFNPALRLLRGFRGLRGTPLDPFGRAEVRREERRLIPWYRGLVESALEHLRPETRATVLELAALPDAIRGYEEIKLANLRATEQHATVLLRNLREPEPSKRIELKVV